MYVTKSVVLPTNPLGEQSAKCNQINPIGKVFQTHHPDSYLPDYLDF